MFHYKDHTNVKKGNLWEIKTPGHLLESPFF